MKRRNRAIPLKTRKFDVPLLRRLASFMYRVPFMRISFLLVCFVWLTESVWTQSSASAYQLLWEVKGKNLKKPSYIFGSMHSNDPRLFQFPDSLYTAFVNAEAVVLETDVTALFDEYDVRLDLFNLEIAAKDKPYTNSREATRTVYGTEDGRPQFLDAHFQQTGYCAGKQFFALEALEDQLKATEKLELLTARSAISSMLFSRETFVQYYIQGDIATLTKMLRSQLDAIPGAYDALISHRNTVMANGLDTLMRQQSVFCAVGSGHLYGSDGILQLLRTKGYSVRAVTATYSDEPTAEHKMVNTWRNYLVENDIYHFGLQLSGRPVEFATKENYRLIYQELGQGNTFELIVRKTEEQIEDYKAQLLDNQRQRPNVLTLPSGLQAVEGMYKDEWKGLQWRRIIVKDDLTYILICYGGNKFMHSDRPSRFFNRLVIR